MKMNTDRFNLTAEYLDLLAMSEYCSLLQLLCPDFPVEMVQNSALPNKLDLLIDPEMDQELERLIAQVAISPNSNSISSSEGQKETSKKASPCKSLHPRKRIMENDGSTEETDSSEN